jgi:translocation and assembly module TamA
VIDAPSPLKATIERNVGLVRWQTYSDMTPELLERLAREAEAEIRNIAAAEGYFSAVADVNVDSEEKPPVVTMTVTPGEPTRITNVDIVVSGDANSEPLGSAVIAKVRDELGSARGQIFRQSAWSTAKDARARDTARKSLRRAKIVHSRADIDPATRAAVLLLELESGPLFRFRRHRDQRARESTRRRWCATTADSRGEPYDEPTLEQFIRRLNASGYFSSVHASIDTASQHPEEATVRVAVVEAQTKSFEGGIGYSTDVPYTARINYRDVNIDGKGLQLLFDAQYDGTIRADRCGSCNRERGGWIGTWTLRRESNRHRGLVTKTRASAPRWNTLDVQRERAFSAFFYLDDQYPDGAPSSRSHALYVEAEQYLREVDVLLAPTRGWMGSLQAGGGIPAFPRAVSAV